VDQPDRLPIAHSSAVEEFKLITAFLKGQISIKEYLSRMDEIFERDLAEGRKPSSAD